MRMLSRLKQPTFTISLAASTICLSFIIMTNHTSAQNQPDLSQLVMRVAIFAPDQSRLDYYRDFVSGHLFPTVRSVPGYVGTFLGKDLTNGHMISVSFWTSESAAAAGEAAVGSAIGVLPTGSAPRPSSVNKYTIAFRDIHEPLLK